MHIELLLSIDKKEKRKRVAGRRHLEGQLAPTLTARASGFLILQHHALCPLLWEE
jgi:hypothetical protein